MGFTCKQKWNPKAVCLCLPQECIMNNLIGTALFIDWNCLQKAQIGALFFKESNHQHLHSSWIQCNIPHFRNLVAATEISQKYKNAFFGGQTVTLGHVISDIGKVSIVVVIGLCSQWRKDCWIKRMDPVNPTKTTNIQKSLTYLFAEGMWAIPWIVEDDKNSLSTSIYV